MNPSRTVAMVSGATPFSYPKVITNCSNVYAHDYLGSYPMIGVTLAAGDELYLSNIVFDNSLATLFFIFTASLESVYAKNITFKNISGQQDAFFLNNFANRVEINDITFENITGSLTPLRSMVSFTDSGTGQYAFDGVVIRNSNLMNSQFLLQSSSTDFITLLNVEISSTNMNSGQSLMLFAKVSHCLISNYTVSNLVASNSNIAETTVIRIRLLDLQSDFDTELYENIDISNSTVSFIKIESLINAPVDKKLIAFSNLSFRDILIESKMSLIDTAGLNHESDVAFEFSNLTFTNIKYTSAGNLLNLGQLFPNDLMIKDSLFSNLDSCSVFIGTSSSESRVAKVSFANTKFSSFYSESSSMVSVFYGAIVQFENCSFTNLSTLSFGAAIYAGASKSAVIASNSVFINNSASEGGVFNIESESTIRCNN